MPNLARLLLLPLLLAALSAHRAERLDGTRFEIWPGALPAGAVEFTPEQQAELLARNTAERIAFVERPTLTAFPAEVAKATGSAVIVCPGGGYSILAWQKEGVEVARWFQAIGVTAFVLEYRVPRRTPDRFHEEPLQDVQRAVRVVRRDAAKWGVDPDRIGTLGFSAGGHLCVLSGVRFATRSYAPVDDADALSCRPDFLCPIYCAYLGDGYDDREQARLGELVTVSKETPPTFMVVTWDDVLRGAQSALLLARLREHGVPAELHVFARGGHGYGMRPSELPVARWPELLEAWLQDRGLLTRR